MLHTPLCLLQNLFAHEFDLFSATYFYVGTAISYIKTFSDIVNNSLDWVPVAAQIQMEI